MICRFALWVLTLSFVTQLTDATLASLIKGPYVVPTGVWFALAAIAIFLASGLQVELYPKRKRASGL